MLIFGTDQIEFFEHEEIARQLLAGHGFQIELYGTSYRTFGSPPFAYLCAFVYALFGHSPLFMLPVQALFSALAACSSFLIGKQLFSARAGWLAGVLVALHPGLVYYDTHKIHSLSFDAALAVVGCWFVLKLSGRHRPRFAALAGLAHGLALFERSPQAGLIPLSFLAMGRVGMNKKSLLRHIAIYCTMGVAVMAPWTIRNFLLLKEPVFVTSTGAEVFWRGNNPSASGGAFAKDHPGLPVFEATTPEFQAQVLGKNETTQRRFFMQEALRYIAGHPWEALSLYGRKWLFFWWFSPHAGFLYPPSYFWVYQGYYLAAGLLAIAGMGAAFKESVGSHHWRWLYLIGFLLSVAFLQAAFYVETRHRWGVEPLLLVFTARGLLPWMKNGGGVCAA